MNEGRIYADLLDNSRELTRWYLSKLKDVDVNKSFEMEGKKYNSVMWEIGHLAVTENFLGLYLTNGPSQRIEWAPTFGIGSSIPSKSEAPEYKDVWATFKQVHQTTIEHIGSLTKEELDAPSRKPYELVNITTVRQAVMHVIRHEGVHCGHLGWLCKMHGIKMV